jgi:hypothetical protein
MEPNLDLPPVAGSLARDVVLAVPLGLVNLVALWGQAAWAHSNVTPSWPAAWALAAAVELVGVWLALEAHHALMAGVAAAHLRLGAYAVAGAVAWLNYSHFAGPGMEPNATAVTFAAMSAASPWLWMIRSRSRWREALAARGLADPRAVHFSGARKLLFPARTFMAFREAVWANITDPVEAVHAGEAARAVRSARRRARAAAPGVAVGLRPVGPPPPPDPVGPPPVAVQGAAAGGPEVGSTPPGPPAAELRDYASGQQMPAQMHF